MQSQYPDEPRSLKRSEVRDERLAAVDTSRVKALNELVRDIRGRRREESTSFKGESIPFFDPMDGGSEAECLFLFEAPGECIEFAAVRR